MHGQMVNPTPHSVKPCHDCCDNLAINVTYEKQLGLDRKLPADHGCRFVPWWVVREYGLPKSDDLSVILGCKWTDLNFGTHGFHLLRGLTHLLIIFLDFIGI